MKTQKQKEIEKIIVFKKKDYDKFMSIMNRAEILEAF